VVLDQIKDKIKLNIKPSRYIHSENVMEAAKNLAGIYGANVDKAAIAGILHDCAKGRTAKELLSLCEKFDMHVDNIEKRQPELLHGPVGAFIAEMDYGIKDEEILNAIRVHTTGKEDMNILEKIVFLADYIEPGRNFPGVCEIREWACKDIDRAIIIALDTTIKYVIAMGGLIHPDSIGARNYLLLQRANIQN